MTRTATPDLREVSQEDDTLASLLGRRPDAQAGTTAVVCGDQSVTYRELRESALALGNGLRHSGVSAGDRCCIYLPNGVSFVKAAWACAAAGVVASPVNPSYRERELVYQLEDSDATAIIVDADNLDVARQSCDQVERDILVVSTTPAPEADTHIEALVAEHEGALSVDRHPEDVILQPYTSGTTGKPKGVLLTNRNFTVQIQQLLSRRLKRDEIGDALVILPMYHITGFLLSVGALTGGQTLHVVRPDRWDPERVLEIVTDEDIEEFVGVATMFSDLLEAFDADEYDVSSLRATQQGGTKIPPEVQAEFEEMFGVEIMEGYGMTETTAAVLSSIDSSLGNRQGSAGQPTGHTRIKVVDEEGAELPDGEVGELLVKGPQVMEGYYDNPEATARAFTEDGYFRTGDVCVRDGDNYVEIKGRKKNTILTGGYNVYPAEVEDAICSHPAITDAIVVGVPDERKGETVAALVVTDDEDLTEEDVKEYVLDEVAPYKHPRIVELRSEVPRTGSGKIKRKSIADDFADRYGE